jgi:mono/diheme cytochrome c family protein
MKFRFRLALVCAATAIGLLAATPALADKNATGLWSKHCASCHGAQGRGDGPDAKTLETRTPDFTDKNFMSARTDDDLFRKLTNGRKPMPGYKKKLSDMQRRQLVSFMRSLVDAK